MMRLAIGSMIGKPSLAMPMPMNDPTDESASERWCQASALKAAESIFLA